MQKFYTVCIRMQSSNPSPVNFWSPRGNKRKVCLNGDENLASGWNDHTKPIRKKSSNKLFSKATNHSFYYIWIFLFLESKHNIIATDYGTK